MSELKYYKLRHIVSALASPDFTTGVVFDNHDEVYYKSEADKVIARHKYKRCLAMAKLCQWKMGVFIYKKEKNEFYYRWYNRWLAIAKKFKEAK